MTQEKDTVALARLFVSGGSLKRADTIRLVRDLLALLDKPVFVRDSAPAWSVILPEVPDQDEDDTRPSPIKVHIGLAGSVFLGPESNRYYTRSEAVALAGAIARAAR